MKPYTYAGNLGSRCALIGQGVEHAQETRPRLGTAARRGIGLGALDHGSAGQNPAGAS